MHMRDRFYLTLSGEVVRADDRREKSLICKKGSYLPDAVAADLGFVDGDLPGDAAPQEVDPRDAKIAELEARVKKLEAKPKTTKVKK